MKKLIALLLLSVSLMACSSNSATSIQNGEEVLFKIEDTPVTKGKIYDMLRFQNVTSQIIVTKSQEMLVSNAVEITDEIKEAAATNLKEAKESLGDFFAIRYGEASDEELLETMFIPAAQQEKFLTDYFNTHKDEIINTDKPVKAHVLYFDTEEAATSALTQLNEGKDISEIITNLGSAQKANLNTKEPVILAQDGMPTIVSEFLKSEEAQAKQWSKAVLSNNEGYYLAKLDNADSAALADEYADTYLKNPTKLQTLMIKVFKDAKFEVYDQAVYDAFKSNPSLADFAPDN